MIVAAQLRLGQLDVLERNVNKLETENEQLRQDAIKIKQEFEARERDLRELEELRLHNKQLVQCVEALEGSRQEYEADAFFWCLDRSCSMGWGSPTPLSILQEEVTQAINSLSRVSTTFM